MAKKIVDKDFHTATAEEIKEVNEVFEETAKAKKKTAAKPRIGKVADCSELNVRETADINSKPVCQIREGDEVAILGEEGDFYKVSIADSLNGYCMKQYIK